MKKSTIVFLSSILVLGTAACSSIDKTGADAPAQADSGNAQQRSGISGGNPSTSSAKNQLRRKQLEEDIQAREQRNDFFNNGSAENRPDRDLASEVRDTLEINLPDSVLDVGVKQGIVTIEGTVPTQEQLARIKPLSLQIKGVQGVNVEANVITAGGN